MRKCKRSKKIITDDYLPPYNANHCKNQIRKGVSGRSFKSRKVGKSYKWELIRTSKSSRKAGLRRYLKSSRRRRSYVVPLDYEAYECPRETSKKYRNRPGPPYKANLCKGAIRKGNDKKSYQSMPNKHGVYVWKLF